MKHILESGFAAKQNMIPALCSTSVSLRALTCEEIEQVSGGLAFIPPVVVAAAQWGGAIAGGVFITRAVNDLYDSWFGEEEMSCSM